MIASIATLAILAVLFINSDLLLREPDKVSSEPVAEEQPPPAEAQSPPAQALAPPAEEADSTAVTVSLSIVTDPVEAAVFVDDDFVGVSPLADLSLAQGTHAIRILKTEYAPLDTVVTLDEASVSLRFMLQEAEPVEVAGADDPPSDALIEESAATSDETTPEETASPPAENPQTPPETNPAETTSPPETEPATETQIDPEPAQTQQQTPTAEDPPAVVEEEPGPQTGELQINSEPSGASVLLGGQQVGVTPLVISDVEPGAQQVTLRLDGYKDYTTTVTVAAQQRRTVRGKLEQDNTQGTLRILAEPWGDIYIDDKLHKRGADVRYTTQLPPGTYKVRIEHPTLGIWKQDVTLAAGEDRSLRMSFLREDK